MGVIKFMIYHHLPTPASATYFVCVGALGTPRSQVELCSHYTLSGSHLRPVAETTIMINIDQTMLNEQENPHHTPGIQWPEGQETQQL